MSDLYIVSVGISSEEIDKLGTVLGDFDYNAEIVSVCTPGPVIDKIAECRPDCIVSEYAFPEGDGLHLLDTVRQTYPSVPFIFYTATGNEAVAGKAFSAGATDYFPHDGTDSQLRQLAKTIRTLDTHPPDGNDNKRSATDRDSHQFRQAIDHADVPILLADPTKPDDPIVYVNTAFEELTGYTADEILGRNCRLLQGEATDPTTSAELREAIDNQETATVELWNYRKDGTKFLNQVTVKPIYDDNGQLVRYLGTQKDITTRKRRQEKLISERRFINQAFNRLKGLFYILDDDGTFRRWNTRLPEVTGYSDAELSEMHVIDIFRAADQPKIADAIRRVFDGQQVTVEAHVQTADDRTIPFELDGSQLTADDGTTTGIVGIGRNISNRKERQQYLELIDRVLRHNLRNNINIIRGKAELIREDSTNGVGTAVETIIQTSDKLTNIAEKQREMAQILQDRPEYIEFDVTDMIYRIVSTMRADYPSASINVQCPDDTSLHVSKRFDMAIEELEGNAIVHSEATPPTVRIEVHVKDEATTLTIIDNGPPIPKMEREILEDGGEQTPLRSWVEDCWSFLSSSWKSQQARVTRPRHPTNDDANQDVRLGASGRESATTDSLVRRRLLPTLP